jgi:hypothetical protein
MHPSSARRARVCGPWRPAAATAAALVMLSASAAQPAAVTAAPVKLAVFDFELEDLSPAQAYLNRPTSSADTLAQVTAAARKQLAESGRYQLVDVQQATGKAATEHTLRNCDGCEAGIAQVLGAEQSLLGVVTRATQTDYYVRIEIRDARSGKLVNQQEANFAGSEEGWPSGVRMLIKHQVLPPPE